MVISILNRARFICESIRLLQIFFTLSCFFYPAGEVFAEESFSIQQEGLEVIRHHYLGTMTKNSSNLPLRELLRQLDSYSDYLPPREYNAFIRSQESHYVGIGMEIEKDSGGDLICYPVPGFPAELSGIKSGDILFAVNGEATSGKSLYTIAATTRGKEGSQLAITTQNAQGETNELIISRLAIEAETISSQEMDGLRLIRISRFTQETRKELKRLLDNMTEEQPLILDLRRNGGGDLHSAIDCAMFFLEQNQPIVTVKRRKQEEKYQSTTTPLPLRYPVYILQDRRTASAAEVFTAALTQNKKGVSIGERSFGKGLTQQIFNLSDGSALFLTTGTLVPPNGKPYHGYGLVPNYPQVGADTSAYLEIVRGLLPPPTELPPVLKQVRKKRVLQKIKHISPLTDELDPVTPEVIQFFACFEQMFAGQQDARQWSGNLSKKNLSTPLHIFKIMDTGTVKSIVCIGPESTRKNIEQSRRDTSHKTGLTMNIQTPFEKTSPADQSYSTVQDFEASKNPFSSESWYIHVGSYRSSQKVIAEQQRILAKNRFLKLGVSIEGSHTSTDLSLKIDLLYRRVGLKSITLLLPIGTPSGPPIHHLFIGPFPEKDQSIMSPLQNSGIVSQNAAWILSEASEEEQRLIHKVVPTHKIQ